MADCVKHRGLIGVCVSMATYNADRGGEVTWTGGHLNKMVATTLFFRLSIEEINIIRPFVRRSLFPKLGLRPPKGPPGGSKGASAYWREYEK